MKETKQEREDRVKAKWGNQDPRIKRLLSPRVAFNRAGRPIKLYTPGHLAVATGYSIKRIRDLVYSDILPPATIVNAGKRNWFSQKYIDCVKEAMLRREGRKLGLFRAAIDLVFEERGLIKDGKNVELLEEE